MFRLPQELIKQVFNFPQRLSHLLRTGICAAGADGRAIIKGNPKRKTFPVEYHQIMTGEEVTELLKTFDISEDQLPTIYHDDPAIKACGGKPGNVIRIIRKSQTAGEATSYRLVVRRPKK